VYYNPSAGTIPDLVESAVEYLLGPTDIDRGLARILNQLAEAGVPVDIFAFSQGGLIVLNAALAGAQFAPSSTVHVFSSPVSEALFNNALPKTVPLNFKPTAFFDPINIPQGLSELAFSGFPALPGTADARLRILGGMLGLAKDRFTRFPTAHKLPDHDAGTSP